MRFDDINSVDNKQRLNLSARAYEVLVNDFGVFQPESASKRGVGELSSGVINHVFREFRMTATSSVAAALARKQQEYDALFAKLEDSHARKESTAICVNAYRAQLHEQVETRLGEKGNSFTIRVDKENCDFLESDEGRAEGVFYRNNVGSYIKAVLEEYCELPSVERERIYFKKELDIAELARLKGHVLKLVLNSKSRTPSGERNNVQYVKVLCCMDDREHLYNYLVGMIAPSQNGPWRIGAVRLVSVKECREQAASAHISASEKREILDAVASRGVQYLSAGEPSDKILVRLTEEGEKLYRRLLHLRPSYAAKDGLTYEFHCSAQQIENYFFKFGHHAKILEPEHLAQKFMRRYTSAARQYESR